MCRTAQNSSSNYYSAFTLIEMLIVMAIIIVLFAVGISSTASIMATFAANNAVATIKDDLRYAQRSAMFLDRDKDENWIFGIGVDFTEIKSGNYTLFKWCSTHPNYHPDTVELNREIPSWDGGSSFGTSFNNTPNGNLPDIKYQDGVEKCTGSIEQLIAIDRRYDTQNTKEIMGSGNIDLRLLSQEGVTPAYLLYESMTGRVFIYNKNGDLLNYSPPTGSDIYPEINNELNSLIVEIGRKRDRRIETELSRQIDDLSKSSNEFEEFKEAEFAEVYSRVYTNSKLIEIEPVTGRILIH